MKHKITLLVTFGLLALASQIQAQYSIGGYLKKGQTYTFGSATLKHYPISGRFSGSIEAMLGANVTNPAGAFGFMVSGDYDLGHNFVLGVGPAYTHPFTNFALDTFKASDVVFAVLVKSPINLVAFFPSKAQTTALHVLN